MAVIAALGLTVAAIAKFELVCLRDLAATPDHDLRYLTRPGWYAVILFAIPLGGCVYL